MSSMWLKILVEIDHTNQVIQARDATIDVEVSNLRSLLEHLKKLKDSWSAILNESELVASAMGIPPEFQPSGSENPKLYLMKLQEMMNLKVQYQVLRNLRKNPSMSLWSLYLVEFRGVLKLLRISTPCFASCGCTWK